MTRRIRFTPFVGAGVFAAALCAPAAAHAGEVPFQPPFPVFTAGSHVSRVATADFDRDGDLDLAPMWATANALIVLRNADGSGSSWSPATVATIGNLQEVAAGDVDGDGDVDLVASTNPQGMAWHENVDGLGTAWSPHGIASVQAPAMAVADVDRDGDMDVLSNGGSPAALRWHENDGAGGTWTTHTIATTSTILVHSLSTADIDGDGDPDALSVEGNAVWYENVGGGTSWATHTAGNTGFTGVASGDIDRDGDVDVVTGAGWHENAASGLWPLHSFGTADALYEPMVRDLDGDGDLDVLGARPTSFPLQAELIWYENLASNGSSWLGRTVSDPEPFGNLPTIADVDGDGDLDALSASGAGPSPLVLRRNDTVHRNACFGPALTVSTAADTPDALEVADIDRDGDVDLISAHATANALLWHENGASGGWTPHTVSPSLTGPLALATADIDRDGDADVVSDFRSGLQLGALWFENTSGGATFIPRSIASATSPPFGSSLVTGDIDGDGDVDVYQASQEMLGRWYPNMSNGSAWGAVPIDGASGDLADIDGDGDLDVASALAGFSGSQVGWVENVAGTGATWSMHTISTEPANPFVVGAADIDGDGDVDFAQGGGGSSALRWRINAGGGASWTLQTVDGAGLGAIVADLDNDGDLDLPWATTPPTFGWHENRNGLGSEWLGHTLPLTGSPAAVGRIGTADIDRDGDVDLIGNPVSLVWYPNQGGQFSLAADNTAPGTADQGSTVSMLRVVATHLGRAGDGALELARFGLLLEEAAGDPLTSAEANLLIESLRVYRDTNGNGIFDPADALVTSIGTLALAAGVQDVPFADGDPNVAVAFGTPRTYFVVVELTADAATQNPNRVRATLLQLGPSASQAEHAAYDLPLAPACPADVSSVVMVATVPVELMGFTIE